MCPHRIFSSKVVPPHASCLTPLIVGSFPLCGALHTDESWSRPLSSIFRRTFAPFLQACGARWFLLSPSVRAVAETVVSCLQRDAMRSVPASRRGSRSKSPFVRRTYAAALVTPRRNAAETSPAAGCSDCLRQHSVCPLSLPSLPLSAYTVFCLSHQPPSVSTNSGDTERGKEARSRFLHFCLKLPLCARAQAVGASCYGSGCSRPRACACVGAAS
eukprot:6193819-Pleurochrysis_carterae.AAC.1